MKKILKSQKNLALSIITASLLTGCSSTWSLTFQDSLNKGFDTIANPVIKEVDGKRIPNLSSQFKNKQGKIFLNMKNSITLKKALDQLAKIDGRKYYLHKDSENIILPQSNIKIKSFNELRLYIEDTMEKTIYISKNAIKLNRPKIIKIQDIREKQWDLKKVNFHLNTEMSIKDALQRLSKNPDFQFSTSIDYDDFGTTDQKIFKDTYINFKGKTVSSFFKYLEEKLNIYIDIDYENKIVHIHKYKKVTFQLNIGNLKMTVSGNADTEVTSDGEAQETAIKETIDVDIYSKLKEHFETLISNAKTKGNERSYHSIDDQTGIISVYADKDTIEQFATKIENTNDAYKDMIEVEIISFDLVFSKDYLFQTGYSATNSKNNKAMTYGLANSVSNVINSAFSYISETANNKTSFLFESLQNMGYIANKKVDRYALRNHIPEGDSTLETERYIKNITTVGATDTTAASQTTETDIIKKPEGYSITAHYSNGMISLDIRDYRGQLLNMETLNAGTETTVSNPKTKSNEAVKHLYLKNNDSFIVKNQSNIESSKDYNGIIPGDWLITNMLGGGNDENILYSQSIKIIKAKKLNNL